MILPVRETIKVRGGANAELGSNPLVRGDVKFVVCPAERRVPGKCARALNATHLVDNSSCREIGVELEKNS